MFYMRETKKRNVFAWIAMRGWMARIEGPGAGALKHVFAQSGQATSKI